MHGHIRLLKELPEFQGSSMTVRSLKGGMTNHNYLITLGPKRYVAHFAPEAFASLGLDKSREVHNCTEAHRLGIGARVVASHPPHGLLVVEYLPGKVITAVRARDPVMISKLALMLRTLHHKGRLKGSLDTVTRTRKYFQIATRAGRWLPAGLGEAKKNFELTVRRLRPLSKTDPCHLDLMLENIVINPHGQPRLLDWEYSSRADFRYDLAMLSVKGGFGTEEDELLARAYGPGGELYLRTRAAAKAIIYFGEALYGVLQAAISKKKSVDYKRYAEENLQEFRSSVRGL